MELYTIYCTEEQTKKALKLGAPIETYKPIIINSKAGGSFTTPTIETVTAEQMIGWLEEQGILVLIDPSQDKFFGTYCLKREDGYWLNRIFLEGLYSSRKEATLSAIDAALEYLSGNKKEREYES